jgi:hypothetical protein
MRKMSRTKVRSLGNFDIGAIRQQHPHRNFQASPRWVDDRDRAISPLRPADHLKGGAMERVESVENLDGRVFYAQGIVSVDAIIPICIVSSRAAESHPMARGGFTVALASSCPCGSFLAYSADCS